MKWLETWLIRRHQQEEPVQKQARTKRTYRAVAKAALFISVMAAIGNFIPEQARAGILSDLFGIPVQAASQGDFAKGNLQTMQLLSPALNINPTASQGGGDVTVVDGSALLPESGPSGTAADIEKPKSGTISRYIVRQGDTLGSIAKLFDVTPNTILWANDHTSASQLKVGEELIILPVPGVRYTVKKGDTLESIAKRYNADATDIGTYNGVDNASLAVGTELIIPNGEIPAASAQKQPSGKSSKIINEPAYGIGPEGTTDQIGYYMAPLTRYVKTQGLHGYNGVDLAAPKGTPLMASASGEVVVAKDGGWNGGYGSYVVIKHDNGSQTLYSHMSKVDVYVGQKVVQGEVIGEVGSTGRSTGPHVHFEIRNGIKNPF